MWGSSVGDATGRSILFKVSQNRGKTVIDFPGLPSV